MNIIVQKCQSADREATRYVEIVLVKIFIIFRFLQLKHFDSKFLGLYSSQRGYSNHITLHNSVRPILTTQQIGYLHVHVLRDIEPNARDFIEVKNKKPLSL